MREVGFKLSVRKSASNPENSKIITPENLIEAKQTDQILFSQLIINSQALKNLRQAPAHPAAALHFAESVKTRLRLGNSKPTRIPLFWIDDLQ
jgi:hypothetical protein